MGVRPEGVRTARKYILLGEIKPNQIDTIARKILANDVILEYGGAPVISAAQLTRYLEETPASRTVNQCVSLLCWI
jgi:hypothetical protein